MPAAWLAIAKRVAVHGLVAVVVTLVLGRCALAVTDRPAVLGLASTTRGASVAEAERLVVLLHGTGGDAADLAWLADALDERGAPKATRYVSLEGPFTRFPGYTWGAFDGAGELAESKSRIDAVIDGYLANGWTPGQLYLVGFSEGAMMSIVVAMGRKERLGGYVAIAPCKGALDWPRWAKGSVPQHGVIAYGTRDRTCRSDGVEHIASTLRAHGQTLELVPFSDDHRIAPEAQLAAIALLRGAPNKAL